MGETNIIPFPQEEPDVQEMMLDGNPETMLSARGAVLLCLSSWKLDKNERAYGCLQRFCEYITMHGYPGGAQKALAELDSMDHPQDAAWVKRTFARYVQDQTALIQYVMGPLLGG